MEAVKLAGLRWHELGPHGTGCSRATRGCSTPSLIPGMLTAGDMACFAEGRPSELAICRRRFTTKPSCWGFESPSPARLRAYWGAVAASSTTSRRAWLQFFIRVEREVVGRNCRNYLLGQLESEGGKGTRTWQWPTGASGRQTHMQVRGLSLGVSSSAVVGFLVRL